MDGGSPQQMATREHKIPKSRGGGDGVNVVWACYQCNETKGNMTDAEFLNWITLGRPNKVKYMRSIGLVPPLSFKERQFEILEWLRSRGHEVVR